MSPTFVGLTQTKNLNPMAYVLADVASLLPLVGLCVASPIFGSCLGFAIAAGPRAQYIATSVFIVGGSTFLEDVVPTGRVVNDDGRMPLFVVGGRNFDHIARFFAALPPKVKS